MSRRTSSDAASGHDNLGRDVAWNFGESVDGSRTKIKCAFCGKVINGGITRLKEHLGHVKGNVAKCNNVSTDVRRNMEQLLQEMKTNKMEKRRRDLIVEEEITRRTLDGEDEDEEDEHVQAILRRSRLEADLEYEQNRYMMDHREHYHEGRSSNQQPLQPMGRSSSLSVRGSRGPRGSYGYASSSTPTERLATMNASLEREHQKMKQTKINPGTKAFKMLKGKLRKAWGQWITHNKVQFSAIESPFTKPLMTTIREVGEHVPPPSAYELAEVYLKEEYQSLKEWTNSLLPQWKQWGVTIMCDGWTGPTKMHLINFLIYSKTGIVFHKSVDATNVPSKDADYYFRLMKKVVEEVGPEIVVQVVTDNEAAIKAGGKKLMQEFPHLYWTGCAAHCIDLILADISKKSNIHKVLQMAQSITQFIYRYDKVVAIMLQFTNDRQLLRPGITRFATNFIALESIIKHKSSLRNMWESEQWKRTKYGQMNDDHAIQVRDIILQLTDEGRKFWTKANDVIKVQEPLVKVLRLVDGDQKPTMGFLYEAMERAKLAIQKNCRYWERYWQIIDHRWDFQLHHDLHAAGYFLNPQFAYKRRDYDIREDEEVMRGVKKVIQRLEPNIDNQIRALNELEIYSLKQEDFSDIVTQRAVKFTNPAKNLILAGIKSVTLHDEGTVELWDFSSNFVFSEGDVGKNRALASVLKLQELNNAVLVSTLTSRLTKEQLSDFQAVVFTDISLEKAIEFNDYCHSHQPPIAFVKAEVRGLFGCVFCDFGPKFTVLDVDGEEPHTGIIASISNDSPALVSCVDDERLEFQDGDLVVFSEVHGMTELNDGKPRKIKNARAYSFTLEEDTTNYGVYQKGGIVTQVKEPKVLNFKPLREALSDPGDFLLSDFSKFDRPPLLHLAFQALDKFVCDLGRYPVAGSEDDAQNLVSIANRINEGSGEAKLENINPAILRLFAFGARAVLNPMAAMFGGIVGQEVVKACSGKFHPLFQFFYFDSAESLPTEKLDPRDFVPQNSRYDAQISVFGSKLQKKLEDATVFVVGSGALGCEFLKNLALMGVSCGSQGKLTVTDDDVIEKSNLSRQFLFRDWNIGQAKSTVASSAAAVINPQLQIVALQNRVGPETENVFNDNFWENLSVVVNALDNVNARLYVDQRCLYFQKPLLESGTLGAKCNTQMVIPHLTENYGASRDPPEKQAPMCTVHSFPHNIDHCLTWARSEFEGLLEKTPAEVNAYLSDPAEYSSAMRNAGDAQARDTLEHVLECFDREKCETFQDCVTWARLKFEDYFANRVKQLTYTFPEDAATSTGSPFWSAPKRFPHPLQFSSADPSHLHFVMSASILRAETFGIPVPDWAKHPKQLTEAVEKVIVPDFQPRKDAKIVTDEKTTSLSSASIDDAAVIDELIGKLESCRKNLPPNFMMRPIQFEKDDDTNYHMDLIVALANMRARNYSIPEVDKLKAKFIAGRIIPAIATATAMATGLVCLELYKVLWGSHKLEDYRNTFANLALPLFSMAEPVPPKVIKHQDMSWTVWDRWVMKGNPTLRELIQWLKDKGLIAYSISCGSCLLYNSMFPRHKDRMDKKMLDLAKEVAKVEIPPYRRHLDVVVACEDDDDNDIDIPLVSIYFS